ncbi:MAG TPA: class I SAM-dependent methyltransferase, partial [Gaiellaceae bacterium]
RCRGTAVRQDPAVEREQLRATFDDAAELYDRARPGYPEPLYDELSALAGLSAGDRVLEIGPGTGKATVPLAERGLDVTAVELGEALAAVAQRNLAPYPNARVVHADFESWRPERGGFEAVVAFTAFHWLDPDTKYERCARLLRAGGALAVVVTHHVHPEGGDPFFADVQDAYERAGEGRAPPLRPDDAGDLRDEFVASGRFEAPAVRRYLYEVEYTADAYIDVLNTYSGHIAMPPSTREQLYEDIRRLIGERTIRKSYLAVLHVARRLP